MTIRSFRCADTQALYEGASPRRFRNIEGVAQRKLQMLDDAVELKDLRSPPGNRLEALRGDRADQYSIRSMTSGECALSGLRPARIALKSSITTERE